MEVLSTSSPIPAPGPLCAQDLVLQPAERRVYQAGAPVPLSALEFDLLHVLMRHCEQVMSRSQIEQHLYTWGATVASNAVEVHVHYLRRKLGRGVIHTVRGAGYVLPRAAAQPPLPAAVAEAAARPDAPSASRRPSA